MEESAPDFAGVLSVFYLTSRSVEDALDESVSGEAFLYVATCEFRLPVSGFDSSRVNFDSRAGAPSRKFLPTRRTRLILVRR